MKSNNIIMGVLVAVIAVMGVAFAAFSTTLEINGSATIDSNWDIEFVPGTCSDVSKDAAAPSSGTVKLKDGSTTTVEVKASLSSPGDSLECSVTVNNKGSLAAVRESWALTTALSDATNYEVTLDASGNDTLAPTNGTETLTMLIKYKDVDVKPTGTATFTATAVYKQAGVQ